MGKYDFEKQDCTRKEELTVDELSFLHRRILNDGPCLKKTDFPGCEGLFHWLADHKYICGDDCEGFFPETKLIAKLFDGSMATYFAAASKKAPRRTDPYLLLSEEEVAAVREYIDGPAVYAEKKDDTPASRDALRTLYYGGFLEPGGACNGVPYYKLLSEDTWEEIQDLLWRSEQAYSNTDVLRKQVDYLATCLEQICDSKLEDRAYWVMNSLIDALPANPKE